MNLTLPLRMLAAVAPAMAKNDIRYYLNGVLIQRTADGIVAVATNGAALVAARETLSGIAPFPDFILPRDLVLTLLKAGRKRTHFTVSAESVACGGVSHEFKPIDGRFPDWRSVYCRPSDALLSPAGFAADVLGVVVESAKAMKKHGVTQYPTLVLGTYGEATAFFSLFNLPDGFQVTGAIGPQRSTDRVQIPDVSDAVVSVTRP